MHRQLLAQAEYAVLQKKYQAIKQQRVSNLSLHTGVAAWELYPMQQISFPAYTWSSKLLYLTGLHIPWLLCIKLGLCPAPAIAAIAKMSTRIRASSGIIAKGSADVDG